MIIDHISEVIFVGLPGPTHHYGGLSTDNVASSINRGRSSNPREAALQAMDLVRLLMYLGVPVAILPPQLRPHMDLLRQHFKGSEEEIIRQAGIAAPALLEKASSASAMWTANAATVAPSVDCTDGRLHITAANLFTNIHRRIEAEDTYRVLKAIFKDIPDCVVHPPLSAAAGMCDEGAANHMRLSPEYSARGLHVFVYGANGSARDPQSARQTLSASRAVATSHQIPPEQALFLRQNPEVIEQGVFHNDVIAVSNGPVLLVHEEAYEGGRQDIESIARAYRALNHGQEPQIITITTEELPLEEAVHTYFFNSQIVTKPGGMMALIAPVEVKLLYEGRAAALLERICEDPSTPIDEWHTIDLRQSMRNGGGPACLRLRVPMTDMQMEAMLSSVRVIADMKLVTDVEQVVRAHYPEFLSSEKLANPGLYQSCRAVLEALSDVMGVPLLA